MKHYVSHSSGLGASDEISRLDRLIELTNIELANHEYVIAQLRRARKKAYIKGTISREVNQQVQDELKFRYGERVKLQVVLELSRRHRKHWVKMRAQRWPSYPTVKLTSDSERSDTTIPEELANPYNVIPDAKIKQTRRLEVASLRYRLYLFANRTLLQKAVKTLRGKNIVCPDGRLHDGGRLLETVNMIESTTVAAPLWMRRKASRQV